MLDFLEAPQNLHFVLSIAVMLLIVLLELISVSLGGGISEAIDSVIPEIDAGVDVDFDMDVDTDFDVPDASPATIAKVLSWFRIGEVPILMLLIIFLTSFGLFGLILQSIFQSITSFFLPALIAVPFALFASLPAVRVIGGLLGKYMPKDETDAVSGKTLIGRVATIISGTAKPENPVQAKVKDEHGKTHYIMVEPDKAEEFFETHSKVVLVSQSGAVFKAISSKSSALNDI